MVKTTLSTTRLGVRLPADDHLDLSVSAVGAPAENGDESEIDLGSHWRETVAYAQVNEDQDVADDEALQREIGNRSI